MTQAHAQAFARCLAKNDAFRSLSVMVIVSSTSQHDDFCYVEYQPKNPDRLATMFQAEQLKRIRTAEQQSGVMVFTAAGFEAGLYECANLDEHGTAPHTLNTLDNWCSCEDFFFVCKGSGMICHHLVEAKRREAKGLLKAQPSPIQNPKSKIQNREDRRARVQANIARDFA
jgi:hypothetical protein